MKQSIIIAFASLPIFLAGCSTGRIPDYHPTVPAASERAIQDQGIELALDPFIENDRTKQCFDLAAVANGIAILHVRVANKTADQTFMVEMKNFHLLTDGAGGQSTAGGTKIERSNAGGTSTELVGAALGGLGGSALFLGGLAAVSRSTEIQRNFISKELGDATLSPGKTREGFIYFAPVPKGKDWTRTALVKVNLIETKTQQMITLQIPLSH